MKVGPDIPAWHHCPMMPARSSAVGVDEYVLFEVVRLNETEALLVVVGQYSAFTEMFFH
jgi:hypothetical protein